MKYPRFVLAGTASRVGKTTVAMGLIAALKKRGLKVQPFKAGPDYIDPSYHSLASGIACRNLDTWMLSKDTVLELFERRAALADMSIVEGVMGLYDGLEDKESGSTAHLAKILRSPVILVLDARSLSRSAAAIVLGYKNFDRGVEIRGVILNNIASPSHFKNIKSAIETKTGTPVLGFLPKEKEMALKERHLGLIPTKERAVDKNFIKKLSALVEKNIDVDGIIRIGRNAATLPVFKKNIFIGKESQPRATIAIARDEAFNFYYEDNLDILRHAGAQIVGFRPLYDERLPEDIDGLYVGGGFPELFAAGLSKNSGLKNAILKKARRGMPIYAECGGLMYLAKELIDFNNKSFPMVGIFDTSVRIGNGLRALGYVDITVNRNNILSKKGNRLRAHVFHWSYLEPEKDKGAFAYKLRKGRGKIVKDGLTNNNILASYAHLHFGSDIRLAENFVKTALESRGQLDIK